jgi:hypothetical protein
MKKTLRVFLVVIFFAGCEKDEDPTYPIEPFIEAATLTFKEGVRVGSSTARYDTLVLTFSYRDGDGDLGLNFESIADLDSPYHSLNAFTEKGDGQLEKIAIRHIANSFDPSSGSFHYALSGTPEVGEKLVTFTTRNKAGYGFLPDLPSCSYLLVQSDDPTKLFITESQKGFVDVARLTETPYTKDGEKMYALGDSVYIEVNPNQYTIDVAFSVQQPNGSFLEFEWYDLYCQSFNGRFPRIPTDKPGAFSSGPFLLKPHTGSTGEIQYAMSSVGFRQLFKNQNLKLTVTIRDRALHTSNTIDTNTLKIPE